MEKMKIEMNKCFGIFTILEQFNYKFSKEDIDRRWNVFGSPSEVLDLIDKRVKELDKNKVIKNKIKNLLFLAQLFITYILFFSKNSQI